MMKETIAVLGVILITSAITIFYIFNHTEALNEAAIESSFRVGDRVRVKIDNRPGMVVGHSLPNGGLMIWVRVGSRKLTTDVDLIGSDGPVEETPYSIVKFRPYELEKEE